jgi:hypothetical protein
MTLRSFIVKSALFLSILWIGSYALARVLDGEFERDRSNKEFWVLSQHGVSVDYAVVGSSRAYNLVDAPTLAKCTGRSAINLGYGGHSTTDMYLTLYLFLAHQNTVQNLLLQIDGYDLNPTREFQSYLYLPYLGDSEVRTTVRQAIGLKRYLTIKVFPLAKYWEYNDFYSPLLLRQAFSGVSFHDQSAGSQLLQDGVRQPSSISADPEFAVDPNALRYLNQLVLLAKSRGIGVTIFTAPMYHRDATFQKNDDAARTYIADYCRENRINYLDFSSADFDRAEFRDYVHLNAGGALRFTPMLADSLTTGSRNCSPLTKRSRFSSYGWFFLSGRRQDYRCLL